MQYDNHVHTHFSADSKMQAADALRQAEELGLGLVFTEHMDIGFPGETDFTFSPQQYWQAYGSLRGDSLRLGVEIGMTPEHRDESRAVADAVPFDLVIGAIHVIDGSDIYYPDRYQCCEKQDIYRRYLQLMADEVRAHSFIDVLAHIDYIARYAPYDNPELEYADFTAEIDAVLHAVIETDTVLELNTRRLASRLALKELVPIYRRYQELGGRFVTIGSDAHKADAIGFQFAAARELAEQCGLRPVTFCERQRVLI